MPASLALVLILINLVLWLFWWRTKISLLSPIDFYWSASRLLGAYLPQAFMNLRSYLIRIHFSGTLFKNTLSGMWRSRCTQTRSICLTHWRLLIGQLKRDFSLSQYALSMLRRMQNFGDVWDFWMLKAEACPALLFLLINRFLQLTLRSWIEHPAQPSEIKGPPTVSDVSSSWNLSRSGACWVSLYQIRYY